MTFEPVSDFDEWRERARKFLNSNSHPDQVQWQSGETGNPDLFEGVQPALLPESPKKLLKVPAEFIPFARHIACHCDPQRWALLYRMLWRLTYGERHLLRVSCDPLTHRLEMLRKAVRRDAHKTKAFVRFRLVPDEQGQDHYIAWHKPDHDVLPLVADFFKRRFQVMRWTIMTPYRSVSWDGDTLDFFPGVSHYEHVHDDAIEDIWKTYYQSTFNPARIKLKMMRQEMPVRYWKTMPETQLIPSMLQDVEKRIADMIEMQNSDTTRHSSRFRSTIANSLSEKKKRI